MLGKVLSIAAASAAGLGGVAMLAVSAAPGPGRAAATATACPGDNGGLTLPPGFCATVFADDLGHVRHIAFAPDGTAYANVWSGRYYPGSKPPADGFLVALKDTDGDGAADVTGRFGETPADGAAGGTGVAVHKGYVYAEVNDRIVRYALTPGQIAPRGKPETVLSGLPLDGDHPMHPFVIDAKGGLFVDLGSATNACQPKNRAPGVAGDQPCTELQTRGGIWRYDAGKLGQAFSPAERYATGIRNAVGLSFDAAGRLYATQHGRDQLPGLWPALYPDAVRAAELPSEELLLVDRAGADFGWPYCYYDGDQKKLVLAPEYGGDGGKAVGVCKDKRAPVAAFPAHWAPNALAIYTGQAFPAAWRGGAFVAFHGSWNRAPAPQAGYNVVFQPLKDGRASGPWVVFADGFAGPGRPSPAGAKYRPTGLAVAPDGALFIADDVKGRIWRVTYRGPAGAPLAAAQAAPPAPAAATPTPAAKPAARALPPGVSAQVVARGDTVFHDNACAACHGADAKGSPLGPDLTAGTWAWSDGSVAGIRETIAKGVLAPKQYRSPMPPRGAASLSDDDLDAVAAYVWSLGRR